MPKPKRISAVRSAGAHSGPYTINICIKGAEARCIINQISASIIKSDTLWPHTILQSVVNEAGEPPLQLKLPSVSANEPFRCIICD